MKKLFLILVFLLAFFLRVYKLGEYPVGFLWDEAALGYNAYSILETGRDEYGKFLPIIFKSFGDYKPGLYVYLTVPTVAIFGLNEFAVRLPSAIAGSLTVILLYLLLAEARFTQIGKRFYADSVPIVAALFLALSPWHINFSRGAWELNVMTFEIILGFFLLLRFLCSKKNYLLYLSALVFLLSLLTYQGAKFLVPVLLLGFVFFFREYLKEVPKKLKVGFLAVFLSGFFLFNFLTIAGGKAGRIKVMSLFSYPRSLEETEVIWNQDDYRRFEWGAFHSSPIFFTRSFLGRYFNYFSGKFLFFSGDWSNQRNGVIYQGVIYYLDALFLVLGLGVLFRKKRDSLENLLLYWLVVSPISAALTRDSISSVRSFAMVIPLVFIIAVGVKGFWGQLARQKPLFGYILGSLSVLGYCCLLVRFLDLYFIHDPIFTSKDRLYGYKEMVSYIKPLVDSKNKVIVTTTYGQPYIFYLFYTKYDPAKYQKIANLKEDPYGDVGEVERVDKIEFRKIYWPDDRAFKNSLFVGDEFGLPLQDIVGQEGISFLKEIKFLNGKTAFRIVETE